MFAEPFDPPRERPHGGEEAATSRESRAHFRASLSSSSSSSRSLSGSTSVSLFEGATTPTTISRPRRVSAGLVTSPGRCGTPAR
jgi:hypothetical protein